MFDAWIGALMVDGPCPRRKEGCVSLTWNQDTVFEKWKVTQTRFIRWHSVRISSVRSQARGIEPCECGISKQFAVCVGSRDTPIMSSVWRGARISVTLYLAPGTSGSGTLKPEVASAFSKATLLASSALCSVRISGVRSLATGGEGSKYGTCRQYEQTMNEEPG